MPTEVCGVQIIEKQNVPSTLKVSSFFVCSLSSSVVRYYIVTFANNCDRDQTKQKCKMFQLAKS